jgi:hypothetical protein
MHKYIAKTTNILGRRVYNFGMYLDHIKKYNFDMDHGNIQGCFKILKFKAISLSLS